MLVKRRKHKANGKQHLYLEESARVGELFLTHALEFLLEFYHVFAVGNPKEEVRVSVLIDTVCGSGCSDCQHSGGAMGSLSSTDRTGIHHYRFMRGNGDEF